MNEREELKDIGRAVEYAERTEAHIANGGAILDLIMPNGKTLGECTFEEIGRYGAWLQDAGRKLKELRASVGIKGLCEWDASDDENFAKYEAAAQ